MAAVDFFLKIDGVDGESTDDKHRGEIDIESFSWGATNNANAAHGGGGGAGKASFQDFHFVARFSKASPRLFVATASGEHFKKATLTVRKSGKDQQEYLTWTLSECIVASYQTGGNQTPVLESVTGDEEPSPEVAAVRNAAAGAPVDEFSLNFAKIEVSYRPQSADGALGNPVTAGWDLATSKKV